MIESRFKTVRSSFILRITYPQSSVTPPLAGPSGRRPPGMWRSPEPSPGSGGPPGLRATHAAWRRWWQPQKARLDHPGDVHFGLLKPISFIPWLWNGQVWPKGPYPNQTKPIQNGQILLYPQDNLPPVLCHAPVSRAWWTSSTGHVTVTRAVPRQWWSTWPEGHSRGMAPVVATTKGQSRPPGRRPLLAYSNPSPSSHGSDMVSLTEGALS